MSRDGAGRRTQRAGDIPAQRATRDVPVPARAGDHHDGDVLAPPSLLRGAPALLHPQSCIHIPFADAARVADPLVARSDRRCGQPARMVVRRVLPVRSDAAGVRPKSRTNLREADGALHRVRYWNAFHHRADRDVQHVDGLTVNRAVLHVDMDAFYASVEQRDDPSTAGKPVIVGGLGGRGVVAAASYEVRKFGVRSAMPMGTALRLCPHAICIRPRMGRYKEVSEQVFQVFHEITPLVQGLSLDEAYLDVTASIALFGDAVTIARRIKSRIRQITGLTASVGVAPNKLVAKIASDLSKPDGLRVVEESHVQEVLDPLSVRRLPGLGRKTGGQVEERGILTLAQLRAAPDALLWPLFGRY